MTSDGFEVGRKVIRKRGCDNDLWLNECKRENVDPFGVHVIEERATFGDTIRIKGFRSKTLWVKNRFILCAPEERPLEDYL